MAWTCSSSSNEGLIGNLMRRGVISSSRIAKAMCSVDRAKYTPNRQSAYVDSPQPIGHGATISAPHMHGMCLELLNDHLFPGAMCLDVGSGTGYLTAIMGNLVKEGGGHAFGIEHIPELVQMSIENVQNDNPMLLDEGVIEFIAGDGRQGLTEHAPFDCIHVGAAAPTIPQALLDQLKPGGRMVIPVGTWNQTLDVVDKAKDGTISRKVETGVMYVPLTDREKQEGGEL